jgi:protein-S-isoprenylcysteine O-methyltransferase Ste14
MKVDAFFWIVFLVLSALNIAVSWRSLPAPHSHGFYRFFAWEFLAALVALDFRVWFVDPWSWHQVVSWLLLLCSLVPLIFGVSTLKKEGENAGSRPDEPQLLTFEKTAHLVTTGIYHYIRHPMYSSLLLLNWGVFFKDPSWLGAALALLASFFLLLTAKADEAECLQYFGHSYKEYIQNTKRFIPFVF